VFLQVKVKPKIKVLEDEKDDETVTSTCHVTDGNGCSEANKVPDTKLDCVDGTIESDEQPLKKLKSVVDENCSSAEANNGGLAFIPIVHFFIYFFYLLLF
jgi:tRNA-dihydrouridine synthase 3